MTMDHVVFTVGSPGTQRTLNKYLLNESLPKHIYVESRSAVETQKNKEKSKWQALPIQAESRRKGGLVKGT